MIHGIGVGIRVVIATENVVQIGIGIIAGIAVKHTQCSPYYGRRGIK